MFSSFQLIAKKTFIFDKKMAERRDDRTRRPASFFFAFQYLATTFLAAGMCGCAVVQMASGALNAVGMALPDSVTGRGPKSVEIHVKGNNDMNTGEDGKALSTIVRLYKLKEQNGFLSTPYSAFGRPDKEKQAMGDALVEVKELVLSPGQTLDVKEKMGGDALYLGVVALFRSPAAQRWRFAFSTDDISWSGIFLEMHNCTMTSAKTAPVGMTLAESARVLPIKCS
jgi:type VI secretion system protein VasD